MERVGVAIVGTGFSAASHAEALRRLPGVELVGVAGSSREKGERAAEQYGAGRGYGSLDELLADDAVDAVHDCTPNYLHAEVNTAVLRAGKHLLSEKPLGLDSGETAALVAEADSAGVVAGVAFNYRHYPLVRQLKALLESGNHGRPHLVRGAYLQDWLLLATDWNWRLEREKGGASRAAGDIGSHWLDLAQYLLSDRVAALIAEVGTLHAERSRPVGELTTFARTGEGEGEAVAVETEDFGSMLLRFASGCRGSLSISQVSPGRKNRLVVEIDTPEAGFAWDQEEPNRLWIGRRDEPNEELVRDPGLLHEAAAALARYPAGHPEGWPDALRNLLADFYAAVAARREGREYEASFATFADAHRTTQIVEAILESHASGGWVELPVGEQVAA